MTCNHIVETTPPPPAFTLSLQTERSSGIPEVRIATSITERIGRLLAAGKTREPLHLRQIFDPNDLQRVSLPVGPDRSVALIKEGGGTTHYTDEDQIAAAHEGEPATRVYENLRMHGGGGWCGLVERLLTGLTGRPAFCNIFVSTEGDTTFRPHYDMWDGLILQCRGEKRWFVGGDDGQPEQKMVLETGDALWLPSGTRHYVTTPRHSVHALFGVPR